MCRCKRIFLHLLADLHHLSNLTYLFFSHKLTVSQVLHDTIWVRCNGQSHVLTTWQLHEELMNAILQPMP
jgi:ABC-type microcin C transport system duplicated ATPase subunit YejF